MDSIFVNDDIDDLSFDIDIEQREDESENSKRPGNQLFKYAVINGSFSNSHEVLRTKKQDIERARIEAIHFYENT